MGFSSSSTADGCGVLRVWRGLTPIDMGRGYQRNLSRQFVITLMDLRIVVFV